MQSIDLNNNSTVLLNLAKNPAGLNASLAIANSMKEEINYLLVLNDNGADGIDISGFGIQILTYWLAKN